VVKIKTGTQAKLFVNYPLTLKTNPTLKALIIFDGIIMTDYIGSQEKREIVQG
jgi:hypothetical protein